MSNWQELGKSMTQLKGKVDVLDVKIDEVHRQARELAEFTETVKLVLLSALLLSSMVLLLHFVG